MKIYIGHSSSFNYQDNLYNPLRNSDLNEKHTIVLPHEDSEEPFNSKDYLKNRCDVFVAEVSEASTGLGIELGWADQYEIPILCIHRASSKPSSSISQVTENIESYRNSKELIEIINKSIV